MCDVAASFFPLSFLPLHWSLSLFPISSSISHVTACVRGNEQKFLLASWLIPPIPSRIHSSTINHPPFITDSISHTPPFIPACPSLASPGCQTRARRFFFFKGEAASCWYQLLGSCYSPLHLSASLPLTSWDPRCRGRADPLLLFFSRLNSLMTVHLFYPSQLRDKPQLCTKSSGQSMALIKDHQSFPL